MWSLTAAFFLPLGVAVAFASGILVVVLGVGGNPPRKRPPAGEPVRGAEAFVHECCLGGDVPTDGHGPQVIQVTRGVPSRVAPGRRLCASEPFGGVGGQVDVRDPGSRSPPRGVGDFPKGGSAGRFTNASPERP